MSYLLNLAHTRLGQDPIEFFYTGGYFDEESIHYAKIEKEGKLYRVTIYNDKLQFLYFYDEDNLNTLERESAFYNEECRTYLEAVNVILDHYALPLRFSKDIYIHYVRDFTSILKDYFKVEGFDYAFFIRDPDLIEDSEPFQFMKDSQSSKE